MRKPIVRSLAVKFFLSTLLVSLLSVIFFFIQEVDRSKSELQVSAITRLEDLSNFTLKQIEQDIRLASYLFTERQREDPFWINDLSDVEKSLFSTFLPVNRSFEKRIKDTSGIIGQSDPRLFCMMDEASLVCEKQESLSNILSARLIIDMDALLDALISDLRGDLNVSIIVASMRNNAFNQNIEATNKLSEFVIEHPFSMGGVSLLATIEFDVSYIKLGVSTSFIVYLAAVLTILFFTVWVVMGLKLRIENIQATLTNNMADGVFGYLPAEGSDELEMLKKIFNKYLDAMAVDKGMLDSLKKSNEQLESFTLAAGHDMRSPLVTINSSLYLLNKSLNGRLSEEEERLISRATSTAIRMDKMLKALLDFSRIRDDDGQHRHSHSWFDVKQAVSDALSITEGELLKKQGYIEVFGSLSLLGRGVQEDLVRVLQNLIFNAIKYCSRQPKLCLIVEKSSSDMMVIKLYDNGIGFPEGCREKAFNVFERLHQTIDEEGSGVGLALCKRLVEAYGGYIEIQRSSDEGSLIVFTWPLKL